MAVGLLAVFVFTLSCCLCAELKEEASNVYLPVAPGVALRLTSYRKQPGTLNIGLSLDRQLTTGRSLMKNMNPWMMMMPMMMMGMFPYMLMGVQMLVMKAFNMSNMVLMVAVMMTLRNFLFTDHFGTGVVYSNLGWREKPLPHFPGYRNEQKPPSGPWQRAGTRKTRW